MDTLEFLNEQEDETEVIDTPEADKAGEPEVEQPEARPAQPRGPDGKFAPKEDARPDEPVMVPLKALHETRDEVKELKAELERLRQPQQPQQQPQVPDMFEDPDGYRAYQEAQVRQAIYAERLNTSYRFAVQQHGQDVVNQATQWARDICDRDPSFNQSVMSQLDPVGFAIEQFQKNQIVSNVDFSEYQQFQAWKSAQEQAQQQAPQGQQQSKPPQSIASLPSSGGVDHVPVGPGQAFDTLFTQ